MQNFTYDPELISTLALEIVCPGTLEASGPWTRYEIAGIEAYSELYVRCHMEDIVMGWDEARDEQPAWADLDDRTGSATWSSPMSPTTIKQPTPIISMTSGLAGSPRSSRTT